LVQEVGIVWEVVGPCAPIAPGNFGLKEALQGATSFPASIRQSKAVCEARPKPEPE
jgi:hypothetical protein